jgi:hypothetical protein
VFHYWHQVICTWQQGKCYLINGNKQEYSVPGAEPEPHRCRSTQMMQLPARSDFAALDTPVRRSKFSQLFYLFVLYFCNRIADLLSKFMIPTILSLYETNYYVFNFSFIPWRFGVFKERVSRDCCWDKATESKIRPKLRFANFVFCLKIGRFKASIRWKSVSQIRQILLWMEIQFWIFKWHIEKRSLRTSYVRTTSVRVVNVRSLVFYREPNLRTLILYSCTILFGP